MEFKIQRNRAPVGPWLLFAPGALLVLLGILIAIVPQLLVALVAGALILAGTLLLAVAWRFRAGGRRPSFSMFGDRFQR